MNEIKATTHQKKNRYCISMVLALRKKESFQMNSHSLLLCNVSSQPVIDLANSNYLLSMATKKS